MSVLRLRTLALIAALLGACTEASSAFAQSAASLKSRHAALHEQLARNQFQRPLYLESSETSGVLKGDVYAVIDQSYAVVGPTLRDLAHWCDILILHQNVKGCRASDTKTRGLLSLNVGRKFDQPLAEAYLFNFIYTSVAADAAYLRVHMDAEQGPLGTSHYRIVLEAVPLDARRSFLHLSYSYSYGAAAQLATRIYLATIGRDKVGFSIVRRKANGQPVYIGSTRGVVERNAMRCYLAVEAYLEALSVPASQQTERRLNSWHAGVERYPIQLHEMQRAEYLEMKHKEIRRQRTTDSVATSD